ncbi:hypothetical protein NC651_006512 [Populus alba x Populus x berolinensis]|nr:hypothetical protein NC651_006512 [Populus alba x Populus x berolinensis]
MVFGLLSLLMGHWIVLWPRFVLKHQL